MRRYRKEREGLTKKELWLLFSFSRTSIFPEMKFERRIKL